MAKKHAKKIPQRKRARKGLPTSLKVFDITYRIEYYTKKRDVSTDGPSLGEIRFDDGVIAIWDGGQQRSTIWGCLRHEAVHAILHVSGRSVPRSKKQMSSEEKLVDHLACGITVVAEDNPGFWDAT